jgi:hypothetical protein
MSKNAALATVCAATRGHFTTEYPSRNKKIALSISRGGATGKQAKKIFLRARAFSKKL